MSPGYFWNIATFEAEGHFYLPNFCSSHLVQVGCWARLASTLFLTGRASNSVKIDTPVSVLILSGDLSQIVLAYSSLNRSPSSGIMRLMLIKNDRGPQDIVKENELFSLSLKWRNEAMTDLYWKAGALQSTMAVYMSCVYSAVEKCFFPLKDTSLAVPLSRLFDMKKT